MQTYQEFLGRIHSFEKKEVFYGWDYFHGNPSIAQKANQDNRFQPFYGDTIVFNLDDTVKGQLAEIVEKLYTQVPECFCEKLVSNTFHMTLHDLSNSPVLQDVAAEAFENELKVVELMKQIQPQKIKMKSKYIFNMVGTSLVLGLYPASEEDYGKLMKLYEMFNAVKCLNYPLTPHITLAYYNVHGFHTESARKLEALVYELNDLEMEFEISTEDLYYQKFTTMNHYVNILKCCPKVRYDNYRI